MGKVRTIQYGVDPAWQKRNTCSLTDQIVLHIK
jgi:hypothetical protein